MERIAFDGFLPGRERRLINVTTTGAKVYQWLVLRRFGDLSGVSAIDPRLGRLLMRPVTISTVARTRSGVEHQVIPPLRYAEPAAAGR